LSGKFKIRIDRRSLEAEEGMSVLEVARDAGIHIPTLCYHPALESVGACRLCVVEITQSGRTHHAASCVTPAAPGMVVKTGTAVVKQMRRTLLDLLLSRCPEVSVLREFGAAAGVAGPSYPLGEEICFLCGMCVRACREIVGVEAIGFAERGVDSQVVPPFSRPSARCIACGTCTTIWPARTFELSKVDATATMHGEGKDARVRKCVVCEEHYSGS
jgi:NADH dehydrogenase/NADH:ubiquinone oxidoreductase subunit G